MLVFRESTNFATFICLNETRYHFSAFVAEFRSIAVNQRNCTVSFLKFLTNISKWKSLRLTILSYRHFITCHFVCLIANYSVAVNIFQLVPIVAICQSAIIAFDLYILSWSESSTMFNYYHDYYFDRIEVDCSN